MKNRCYVFPIERAISTILDIRSPFKTHSPIMAVAGLNSWITKLGSKYKPNKKVFQKNVTKNYFFGFSETLGFQDDTLII